MSTCSTVPLNPAENSGLPLYADARASNEIQTAVGSCNNQDEFKQRVNDGIRRLMYRGDWPGTQLPIHLTVQRGIVTFPRFVGSVRYINVTRRYIPVWNGLWTFLPHSWGTTLGCCAFENWLDPYAPSMTGYGTSATFNQPPTSSCVLQISGIPSDDGAVTQFFGLDPNGNPLRTDNGDGTFSDGISLTVNQPLTTGTDLVQTISRVIKPVTQGQISVSCVDSVSGTVTALAVYDPGDTNPSFAQYNLHAACCNPTVTWSAVAMVKLKFIPAVSDSDLVMIPNLSALALFIKGVRYAEQGDRASALGYQADAVKELNLQYADARPNNQIPINVNPFGSAEPWKRGIGRIY